MAIVLTVPAKSQQEIIENINQVKQVEAQMGQLKQVAAIHTDKVNTILGTIVDVADVELPEEAKVEFSADASQIRILSVEEWEAEQAELQAKHEAEQAAATQE